MKRLYRFNILFFLIVLVACAGITHKEIISTVYSSLDTAATIYEASMATAQDLNSKGLLPPDVKLQIEKVAKIYHATYHGSVELLAIYKRTHSAQDKDELFTALSELAKRASEFKALIQPFIGG